MINVSLTIPTPQIISKDAHALLTAWAKKIGASYVYYFGRGGYLMDYDYKFEEKEKAEQFVTIVTKRFGNVYNAKDNNIQKVTGTRGRTISVSSDSAVLSAASGGGSNVSIPQMDIARVGESRSPSISPL